MSCFEVLASWLNLLPDHNLPNTTIRTAVITAVRTLPIETDLNDRKEELKRSGLGRIIMFLSTLPEAGHSLVKGCSKGVQRGVTGASKECQKGCYRGVKGEI